jgi:hypothetical protein
MSKNEVDTMQRYSPLKIPTIVKASWRSAGKPSINFMAEPSTVKSELTAAAAQEIAETENRDFIDWNHVPLETKRTVYANPEKYFIFADYRASETDIGELRLQNMNNAEPFITFKYNLLFEVLSHENAMGILFFDEMNNAPGLVKAQFYKVLNDKAIGDIPLSKHVLCICAGNEAKHSRIVSKDSEPLVLRRGNFFLRPLSSIEFLDYAAANKIHQHIMGYLAFQPGDTHKIAYDLPDGVGQPCPRTWTRLSQILRSNPEMPLEDIEMFTTGWVGQGTAKKFTAYVKAAKTIDLPSILKNPELINEYESASELSLVYAIISGLIDTYREDSKKLPQVLAVASHMKRVELGTFFFRGTKYADERNFAKRFATLPPELTRSLVEKYSKFLV